MSPWSSLIGRLHRGESPASAHQCVNQSDQVNNAIVNGALFWPPLETRLDLDLFRHPSNVSILMPCGRCRAGDPYIVEDRRCRTRKRDGETGRLRASAGASPKRTALNAGEAGPTLSRRPLRMQAMVPGRMMRAVTCADAGAIPKKGAGAAP